MVKRYSQLYLTAAPQRHGITAPSKRGLDSPRPMLSVTSEALFAGADELEITHQGAQYRLRQTALGKLILTK